jgi:hypothetical protein
MFRIRPEQLEILTESGFEGQIIDHVREFFPEACADLGMERLWILVREAIKQARAHGLEEGPHICLFVDLTFIFGRDFDSQPWADEILGDATTAVQRDVQMLRLKHAAFDRLDAMETHA